ncbi:MAG TPA: nuclear transport factor 2 family protein [Blastocatellia bacterium]|jgi:ketosteroid isomerase-like protein
MTDLIDRASADYRSQTEQRLRKLNEEWVAAFVQGDTATLDRLMAEDCIFTYALQGDDKAQFISDIASGALRAESLKRDNVEVRVYGPTGVMFALDTADWHYRGRHIQGHYRTIHVYSEIDGKWQIVAIHASPLSM